MTSAMGLSCHPTPSFTALQRCNGQTGNAVTCAERAYSICGRCLDADPLDRRSDAVGNVGPHLQNKGRKSRRFCDDGRIDVSDRKAKRLYASERLPEKQQARYVLVLRIVRPKAGADISGACGAKYGVNHRVGQGIRIRMAVKSLLERDLHPTQNKTPTGD